MFRIVIATFKIDNKETKFRFFKRIFLFANFSIDIVFIILFLIFSNLKINFLKLKIFEINYVLIETIPTIKQIKLIKQKSLQL